MTKNRKYSVAFKISCVKAVLEGSESIRGVAREQGIDHSLVKRWCRYYEHYGFPGLQARVGKRVFSSSFKLGVLRVIKKQKLSLKQACLHFHLSSESLIVTWQKRFNQSGLAGLQPRKKGRTLMKKSENQPYKRKPTSAKQPLTREEELLKENEYLRAENALLKKLQALVQADKKRK